MSIWDWLMNPSGLTPHGFCLSWAPGLIATHVIADAVIGLAYFSIPLAIASLLRRRPDIRYSWVAYLFVGFILACGTTHLWAILTLWYPAYGVEAVIKTVTAILSLATAGVLWPLLPKIAALPSAADLARVNSELEARVAERTAELTKTLAQRDLLLREVYHRVKNNLQIVDGMMVMQARRLADPQAKQALSDMRSRLHALGLVHHQLMESLDLETFDIGPFLRELTQNVMQSGPPSEVGFTVRSSLLTVGLDFAIPLGLIVTELVTNALKHAFPDGVGQIEVSLEQDQAGLVTLVVADDGKGLDPESDRTSLGSTIVEGLVKQLGGTLSVNHENGVRSEIRVPGPAST